jgi:hypothetical protein
MKEEAVDDLARDSDGGAFSDCRVAASSIGFFIHAYEGGVLTEYGFDLRDKQIYEKKNKCFYAQADRPLSRIDLVRCRRDRRFGSNTLSRQR